MLVCGVINHDSHYEVVVGTIALNDGEKLWATMLAERPDDHHGLLSLGASIDPTSISCSSYVGGNDGKFRAGVV